MVLIRNQSFALLFALFLFTQTLTSGRQIRSKGTLQRINGDRNTFLKEHTREKRSVGGLIVGTAVFVSLVNIGVDIYLQIEECCGPYPDTCRYQKNFEDDKKRIEDVSEAIDAHYLAGQNIITYLSQSNSKNEEIWQEMKRITQILENLIETIDPEIIVAFNNKSKEITDAVQAKNNTVTQWTNADIDSAFKSIWDSSLGKVQLLSGILGETATITLTFASRWYRNYKTTNMLNANKAQLTNIDNSKAVKMLGGQDFDSFIGETSKSRQRADIAYSRSGKFVSAVTNILLLIQIGVEIWMTIEKFKQCKDTRDQVKKASETIHTERIELETLLGTIKEFEANVTEAYGMVYSQLTDEDFLYNLELVKNISLGASSQTAELADASTTITSFMSSIKSTTNKQQIFTKQKALISALSSVTFTVNCYQNKIKSLALTAERCESGNDILENIYNQAIKDFDANEASCTTTAGLAYTTLSDATSYNNEKAQLRGYNPDCLLNNKLKLQSVCVGKCDQKSDADIATSLGITIDYVSAFKAMCPETCPLSVAEKLQVCQLKGFGLPLASIITVFKTKDAAEVETVYNTC